MAEILTVAKRYQHAAVPMFIILVSCIASATPESVSIFGFRLPETCPFHLFTGLDCPGCGITRAVIFAFHGQWRESYMMHLWGIPLALFFVYRALSESYIAITGRSVPLIIPVPLRIWRSHVIGLSLLIPWLMKTFGLLISWRLGG